MATIPDSIKARLDADWTGAGGTEPAYYVGEDFRTNPPLGKDGVWILSGTLDTDPRVVNDKYVDEFHTIDIIVNTQTSEDRLKELADEVVRIMNATTITDVTYQRLMRRRNISDADHRGIFNYQTVLTYDLRQTMKDSAASYGSGTTGDFAVVGNLTVGGTAAVTGVLSAYSGLYASVTNNLRLHHDGADAYLTNALGDLYMPTTAVKNNADSKGFYTGAGDDGRFYHDGSDTRLVTSTGNLQLEDGTDTVTLTNIADLLMFGSANAAWVPCAFEGTTQIGKWTHDVNGRLLNVDAQDFYATYLCPLPTTKGSLKLYVAGTQVSLNDADAGDKVDDTFVFGLTSTTVDELDRLQTDRTTAGDHEDTFTAVDCSGYVQIKLLLNCIVTDANQLDINGVSLKCYYAA
jgi:hypothetical protein